MRNHPATGPVLAIFGAVAFLVVSLFTWYTIDLAKIPVGAKFAAQYAKTADFATSANAWEPWGLLSDLLMLTVIFGAVALAVMLLTGGGRQLAPAGGLLVIGIVGTLLVMFHILGGPQPSEIVTVQPISWLGALATIAIAVGGYLSFDFAQHGPGTAAPSASATPAQRSAGEQRRDKGSLWDGQDFR